MKKRDKRFVLMMWGQLSSHLQHQRNMVIISKTRLLLTLINHFGTNILTSVLINKVSPGEGL